VANTNRRRAMRRAVSEHLALPDSEARLDALRALPRAKVLPALLSQMASPDETVKLRTAEALGVLVADLADEDKKAALEIMGRLHWSLSEESGAIGWGALEAMGEIVARHDGLAKKYAGILVSYITQDDDFLEHEPLLCGAAWAVGRAAESRPEQMRELGAVERLRELSQAYSGPVREAAEKALKAFEA